MKVGSAPFTSISDSKRSRSEIGMKSSRGRHNRNKFLQKGGSFMDKLENNMKNYDKLSVTSQACSAKSSQKQRF